jgi:hypothetical protein
MKQNSKVSARQQGRILDVGDLRLALLNLNKYGYDLYVSGRGAKRIQVTCKKTDTRFAVEEVRDDSPVR